MLTVKIKSYDVRFQTYEIGVFDTTTMKVTESLVPEVMISYIAPQLVEEVINNDIGLPYGLVNRSFTMTSPLVD